MFVFRQKKKPEKKHFLFLPARRSSEPSATPVSVAKSSCARVMRRLADSGKEALVPSSLAGGTGERSKEAAAAAE